MKTDFSISEKDLRRRIIHDALQEISEKPLEERVLTRLKNLENAESVEKTFHQIMCELEGWGPLSVLFRDPEVTEILVNAPSEIFYEKRGELLSLTDAFSSALTFERLIRRLLCDIDRVADLRHPLVDGTLSDGTRVHIALPPVVRSPTLSLRRHLQHANRVTELSDQKLLDEDTCTRLLHKLNGRSNILICGETGSGKTTLLRALLNELPSSERVVTVEDTLELGLSRPNTVSLLSRHSPDGLLPSIKLTDLVRHALRMRPDRIVVGEIRDEEALVFLDAVSTGHRGSMSSIHGSSCRQALSRLEQLASRSAPQWPIELVRKLIFESVDLVVCVTRKKEGRRITEICEMAGLESFGFLLEPWWQRDLGP